MLETPTTLENTRPAAQREVMDDESREYLQRLAGSNATLHPETLNYGPDDTLTAAAIAQMMRGITRRDSLLKGVYVAETTYKNPDHETCPAHVFISHSLGAQELAAQTDSVILQSNAMLAGLQSPLRIPEHS